MLSPDLSSRIYTRREMLRRMSSGMGMVGLASMLGTGKALAASSPGQTPPIVPKAKRVIFLFLNGGPSHIDTFDPKPALFKYQGQRPSGDLYREDKAGVFMPSPFKFSRHGKSGIEVSENLPHLAKVIDDCCVIRSMQTDIPNHEPALLQMHSGSIQPTRPSIGSWLLYGLGSENENLPGYVVLRPSNKIVVGPALWSNGFLPAEYQATSVVTEDMRVEKLLANIKNPKLNDTEQRKQVDIAQQLNAWHKQKRNHSPELEAQIKFMETAYNMQKAAMDTFDISKESRKTQEMYGETPFARSCLLARRLVEDGVRFVSVYYTNKGNQPWDTHKNHNERHVDLCADADRAGAALITDLKRRGLLEDTLVIWGGEFGRTPYMEVRDGKDTLGRDHHSTAFSMLLAGGGVKGGMVYGSSDELGMLVEENPMHVHDFHATILHLLGINHEELTYRYAGRDFRLTDVHGRVAHEIMV